MANPTPTPPGGDRAGLYAFEGLDRVFHEKARLAILTSLLAHRDGLGFAELRQLCSLTDGNLSRHLQTLQEAEMVEIWKGTDGKRQWTLVRMTADGRTRFVDYLGVLESIVTGALHGVEGAPEPGRVGFRPA